MSPELFIAITYPVNDPESLTVDTNVKDECLVDLLGEVLRSEMGAGSDKSEAIHRDAYEVRIDIDLSCDDIRISSNCGNKGLTTGILISTLKIINSRSTKLTT